VRSVQGSSVQDVRPELPDQASDPEQEQALLEAPEVRPHLRVGPVDEAGVPVPDHAMREGVAARLPGLVERDDLRVEGLPDRPELLVHVGLGEGGVADDEVEDAGAHGRGH
jgi:hypothetical protein